MSAFILRYAGTKRFAGLYAAETEDELFDLIDEETDPSDYEYATVRYGFGIEFRAGEWTVNYKIGKGDKALHAALAKADHIYLTEALYGALAVGRGLRWRRLYQD